MDGNELIEKPRGRRSAEEVRRLVSEFGTSGMKRSEFCRARGLSLGTLQRHLKRARQKVKPTPRLVPVELAGNATPRATAIAVVVGRDRRIEVRPGFDARTLEELIVVLERT
jgi:hypothetical protein